MSKENLILTSLLPAKELNKILKTWDHKNWKKNIKKALKAQKTTTD